MPRFLSIADHASSSPRPIHGVLTGPASRRLVISALPGVRPDGTLPDGLPAQVEQVFVNLAILIDAAGLDRDELVRIAAYVTTPGSKALIYRAATTALGGLRAATAIRQVMSLSQAGCLIEIDAEAVQEL